MSCTKHSPGDGPIKQEYLSKIREANDLYLAEMHSARRRADKRKAKRLKKIRAWLAKQPADAFQFVGKGAGRARVKRVALTTIESISVENKTSWSGRSTVSLPRLSCLEAQR